MSWLHLFLFVDGHSSSAQAPQPTGFLLLEHFYLPFRTSLHLHHHKGRAVSSLDCCCCEVTATSEHWEAVLRLRGNDRRCSWTDLPAPLTLSQIDTHLSGQVHVLDKTRKGWNENPERVHVPIQNLTSMMFRYDNDLVLTGFSDSDSHYDNIKKYDGAKYQQ